MFGVFYDEDRLMMTIWGIVITVILLFLAGKCYGHGEGCIDNGYRVTHFDPNQPGDWNVDYNGEHVHELIHPSDSSLNLLHWYDNEDIPYGDCGTTRPVNSQPSDSTSDSTSSTSQSTSTSSSS